MSNKYYKSTIKSLITIALPTMLEQILSVLMQYVDTAMVGHLGEKATAAVSVSTSITWLIGSIPSAFGIATMALIAQAIGSEDYDEIKHISKNSMMFSIVIGILIGGLCLVLSPYVPIWMGAEADVIAPAREYFFIISLGIIFRSLYIILASAIRATKDTKTPMYIGVFSNFLNVIFNYIFIYGFGLGVKGAALASLLCGAIAGILTVVAFWKKDVLRFDLSHLGLEANVLNRMWRLSFPVLVTNVISCTGYVVFAGLVSHMGTVIFAAHSIAVSAEELFYIGGYGFKSAATTLIGISYGEANNEKYKAVRRCSTAMTVLVMTLSGVLLFAFAKPIMSIFTNSQTVIDLGSTVLRMVAFSEPFFGLYIISEGIYYGLGQTKYPMAIELVSMWVVRILSTYICIHFFDANLCMVWGCMIADNVTKAILMTIKIPRDCC